MIAYLHATRYQKAEGQTSLFEISLVFFFFARSHKLKCQITKYKFSYSLVS